MSRLLKSVWIIFSALLFCSTLAFAQEEITITSYYPSPYGIYRELTATEKLYVGDSNNIHHNWSNSTYYGMPADGGMLFFMSASSNFRGTTDNTEPMWIGRYNPASGRSEIRMNIGDDLGGALPNDAFVVGSTTGSPGLRVWNPIMTASAARMVDINGYLYVAKRTSAVPPVREDPNMGTATAGYPGAFFAYNIANGGETLIINSSTARTGGFKFADYNQSGTGNVLVTVKGQVATCSGCVGIATETPSEKLTVNGDIRADGYVIARQGYKVNDGPANGMSRRIKITGGGGGCTLRFNGGILTDCISGPACDCIVLNVNDN